MGLAKKDEYQNRVLVPVARLALEQPDNLELAREYWSCIRHYCSLCIMERDYQSFISMLNRSRREFLPKNVAELLLMAIDHDICQADALQELRDLTHRAGDCNVIFHLQMALLKLYKLRLTQGGAAAAEAVRQELVALSKKYPRDANLDHLGIPTNGL